MPKISLFAAILFLCLAVPALGSGSSVLYGMVSHEGQPLPDTLITIIGETTYTSASTHTDEHGVYFFENLPADEYLIRAIAKPGGVYETGTRNVIVTKGKEKKADIKLKKK